MTDWNKLKVADLKEELKSRGIPLTGLKLKQRFIDKLVELDEAGDSEAKKDKSESGLEVAQAEVHDVQPEKAEPDEEKGFEGEGQVREKEIDKADDAASKSNTDVKEKEAENAPNLQPASALFQPKEEDAMTTNNEVTKTEESPSTTADDNTVKIAPAETTDEDITIEKAVANDLTSNPAISRPIRITEVSQQMPQHERAAESSSVSTPSSLQVSTAELVEDSRKRKRRSVTPPPTAADVAQKKAKTSNGTPIITKREPSALDEIQKATNQAETLRSADGLEKDQPTNMLSAIPNTQAMDIAKPEPELKDVPMQDQDPSPSRDKPASPSAREPEHERYVAPARHPATTSLYMRNFKRPLHIPTLRNHIVTLATSSSLSQADDPIKTFYLDSIRTHAFVSFNSISAASRVRSAMHDVRFPDEPNREQLYVDFVPDEKVQEWIDEESRSGRGGGGKYEVVYTDVEGTVEAQLQAAGGGTAGNGMRGAGAVSFSQTPVPVRSMPGVSGTAPAAMLGIHPDRARLVPQDSSDSNSHHRPSATASKPSLSNTGNNNGSGFKALDELFRFTTAKPKLYFQPVPKGIADDRLNLMKELRTGYEKMGRTGEEGMKRYSFEAVRGKEEWVDKGPEFGFGPRGMGRLNGRGAGTSGYRGETRGGGYRGDRRGRGRLDRDRGDVYRGR